MPQPTKVFTDDEFDTYEDGLLDDRRLEPLTRDDRNMAMLAHLSAFAGLVFPFGNVLGPLAIWLAKRDQSNFIGDHALEALNFQITMSIAGLVGAVLCLVLIGFILLPLLGIAWLVLTIMAGIRANEGKDYVYPFTLRLVS